MTAARFRRVRRSSCHVTRAALDEESLDGVLGSEIVEKPVEPLLKPDGVFAGQQRSPRRHAVLEGIAARAIFALDGAGSSAFFSIKAIGLDLGGGGHIRAPFPSRVDHVSVKSQARCGSMDATSWRRTTGLNKEDRASFRFCQAFPRFLAVASRCNRPIGNDRGNRQGWKRASRQTIGDDRDRVRGEIKGKNSMVQKLLVRANALAVAALVEGVA